MTRFDPWQNRPDRPARRRRLSSGARDLLVWLTVLAVLVIGYTYRDELAGAGGSALTTLFSGLGVR